MEHETFLESCFRLHIMKHTFIYPRRIAEGELSHLFEFFFTFFVYFIYGS